MLRIGLVGCGGAGTSHIREIVKLKELYTLAALADLREEAVRQRAKEFNVPAWYTDYEEMFAKEKLDAVAVTTSSEAHHPVVLAAAKYKLPVICEKPIANSVDEGWEMAGAMKEAGKVFAITYTYHFVPDTAKLKEIIDSGVIGDLLEVRYFRLGYNEIDLPPEGTAERRHYDVIWQREFGMSYDCGVHAFDLFRWYSGSDVKKISAQGICRMGYEYPDAVTAMLEMENGVRCIYDHGSMPHMSDYGEHVFMIILTGRKGCAVWRFNGRSPLGQTYGNSSIDVYSASGVQRYEYPSYSKCRDVEYEQFVKVVQQNSLAGTPFVSPEDAVKATEVGLAVTRAAMDNLVPAKR